MDYEESRPIAEKWQQRVLRAQNPASLHPPPPPPPDPPPPHSTHHPTPPTPPTPTHPHQPTSAGTYLSCNIHQWHAWSPPTQIANQNIWRWFEAIHGTDTDNGAEALQKDLDNLYQWSNTLQLWYHLEKNVRSSHSATDHLKASLNCTSIRSNPTDH